MRATESIEMAPNRPEALIHRGMAPTSRALRRGAEDFNRAELTDLPLFNNAA